MIHSLKLSLSLAFHLIISCTYAQETKVYNIVHNNINRNYRVHFPADFSIDDHLPLVFNFHGFTSNALEQEIYSGMNSIADEEKFIVCYPNGINNAWNVRWGIGSNANDIDFIRQLINKLQVDFNINEKKVYACGMSNGGFFSYELACNLSDKIAAIASVTGSLSPAQYNSCGAENKMPILEIHGTADNVVNYNGTPLIGVSIPQLLSFWQSKLACDLSPIKEDWPNDDPDDGTLTEVYTYQNCANNNKLVHFKVINGGHTWPGSTFINGVTSQDFNASNEIWQFFKDVELDVISKTHESNNFQEIKIIPNPTQHNIEFALQKPSLVRINNSLGQQLKYSYNEAGLINFDISSWQSGLYTLHIISDSSSHSYQFIKL